MNISTRFRLLVLLLALPLMVFAEQAVQHKLVFRSGRVVTGEIVLRNEDVDRESRFHASSIGQKHVAFMERAEVKEF